MLKIAQKSDYALRIAVRLAQLGQGGRLSLDELAVQEGLSQGYLEEVAGLLRAAGIIVGRRGAHGGYALAKNADSISLASIITATEGMAWGKECIAVKRADKSGIAHTLEKSAAAHDTENLWRSVQGKLMATLHGTTVADVLASQKVS